jgi:hypothetical protein
VPWHVESWVGAEATSRGSLADRGRCKGPDCQRCDLHPDVASLSRPFAVCLLPPASGTSFSDKLSLPGTSRCGCCRRSACAASRASSTTCRRVAACSMLAVV